MSVMPETSQSARGPYVASAEVTLALNSWTAVCRSSLAVNMLSLRISTSAHLYLLYLLLARAHPSTQGYDYLCDFDAGVSVEKG